MRLSAIAAFASLFSLPSLAADKKSSLPGVDKDYRILQPETRPEVEADSPYGPGFKKIGDTWVRISGRVRYDVDVSTQKKKRQK